jgi:hypothetical protein
MYWSTTVRFANESTSVNLLFQQNSSIVFARLLTRTVINSNCQYIAVLRLSAIGGATLRFGGCSRHLFRRYPRDAYVSCVNRQGTSAHARYYVSECHRCGTRFSQIEPTVNCYNACNCWLGNMCSFD